ncbi:MAG: DNA polymerase III subunit chi [Zetaproteobacteria bacterium]|nr:DNA polymerase III subunit chi [Zetaproteobacteria bacterium]
MATDMQVHFERLNQPDRVEGIARLLLRRNRLTPSVLVLCPNDGFAAQLNDRLWTVQATSFLAHGMAGDNADENAKQPILLATHICQDNGAKVLINGTLEVPPELSAFAHVVDFVDAWDERLTQAARERFKTYRQLSLEPSYLGTKK